MTDSQVMGLYNYFSDAFNWIDFFVVLTGWLDTFANFGNFSAFRALRVLRPLRLIRYFTGIQAILGSIYHNLNLIMNVLSFMAFFLLIFGILGINNFGGKYSHRCVVTAPVGPLSDTAFADIGEIASWGELPTFCSDDTGLAPLGECPAYQECKAGNENPHRGDASFDTFGNAFLIMFQVQTLSTWYEYDYYNMQSIATIATLYNQGLIFLVGFIVSQLFVAIICFGFTNLEEQLSQPVFSSAVLGRPKLMEADDEDDLCACCEPEPHPLLGMSMEEPPQRGSRDGIRVNLHYKHHQSAPYPLDIRGEFCAGHGEPSDVAVEMNPLAGDSAVEEKAETLCSTPQSAHPNEEQGIGDVDDEYDHYCKRMAQMQKEVADEKARIDAMPPRPAEEDPDIQELEFNYAELRAWSNEVLTSA